MSCHEFIDAIDACLEGDLSWHISSEGPNHLDFCAPCRSYLSTYRETIQMARAAMYDPPRNAPEDWVTDTLCRFGGE